MVVSSVVGKGSSVVSKGSSVVSKGSSVVSKGSSVVSKGLLVNVVGKRSSGCKAYAQVIGNGSASKVWGIRITCKT